MASDPLAVFERIGRIVEERWAEVGHDAAAFPALAAAVLIEAPPEVTARDLLTWVLSTNALPEQFDPASKFGQPPLTMYRTSRFLIDALFWMEGTTDIHQHGFSGAFQVLAGSSVHSEYAFHVDEQVSPALLLGRVEFQRFEILKPGDTRTIGAGNALIHALFHLERPSVTIVIRTLREPDAGPQFQYHAPSIAVDPFTDDVVLQRRIEALEVLHAIDPTQHDAEVGAVFDQAELLTVFRVARHHLGKVQDLDRLRALLERARPRHGARIDHLLPVLEEIARLGSIIHKRTLMKGADHRFFLALLLNLPTRATIFEAVAQRHPNNDPVDLVMQWIQDLATALVEHRDAVVEADHTPAVLAEMLRGHTGEALLARLKEEFDEDDVERARDQIAAIERTMRSAPMLRPLFR